MLRESGRVVAVEADGVWVETIRSSLCGQCAAKAGCGQGVLARAGRGKGLIRARATSTWPATSCAVDDEVDIELPESAVLRGSLLVYGLPLGLAIAGASLGQRISEGSAVATFVAGLGLGFILVRMIPMLLGAEEQFEPRLAAVRKPSQDVIVAG